MLKQYKQNQNLSQRNPYEIRARENNPQSRSYLDRRVNSLRAGKSFVCAWYLLEYVIDTYPEICNHFKQIFELLGLPGCQSLIDDWLDHLIGEKTNIDILQDVKNNKYCENVDVIKYTAEIDTFILDYFNRKKDKDELRPRVTLEATPFSKGSPYLHAAIEYRTLANFYAFDPEKYIDPEADEIMTSSKDSRVKRKLTKFFSNKDLWKMSHKADLINTAERWYKCRVNPGTIEAYLNEESRTNYLSRIDSPQVSREIEEYDNTLGYPR